MKTKVTLTTFFILTVLTALAWQAITATAQSRGFVTKGLVSYWSFDKITGKTVKDESGKNDGTIEGNPGIVEGKLGECLKFSSKRGDDFVVVKDNASLDVCKDSDYSVELWLNPTEVRQQFMFLKGSDAFSFGYMMGMNRFNTPNINLVKCGVTDQCKEYEFAAGKWYHVVGVQTAPQVEYFINGVSVGVYAHASAYTANLVGDFKIGGGNTYADVEDFYGLIDELRIYDRALSKGEIAQNFAVKFAVDPAGKSALTWGEIKVSR